MAASTVHAQPWQDAACLPATPRRSLIADAPVMRRALTTGASAAPVADQVHSPLSSADLPASWTRSPPCRPAVPWHFTRTPAHAEPIFPLPPQARRVARGSQMASRSEGFSVRSDYQSCSLACATSVTLLTTPVSAHRRAAPRAAGRSRRSASACRGPPRRRACAAARRRRPSAAPRRCAPWPPCLPTGPPPRTRTPRPLRRRRPGGPRARRSGLGHGGRPPRSLRTRTSRRPTPPGPPARPPARRPRGTRGPAVAPGPTARPGRRTAARPLRRPAQPAPHASRPCRAAPPRAARGVRQPLEARRTGCCALRARRRRWPRVCWASCPAVAGAHRVHCHAPPRLQAVCIPATAAGWCIRSAVHVVSLRYHV